MAMSGGVDSSVAAWMLAREGLDLVGLFMRNGVEVAEGESHKKSCCSVSDARDARMVASHLGIPFQSVDLKDEFGAVIRYFLAEYARGRTPNPCVVCNRDLKFGRLLRFADELGARGVATGHYARLAIEGGRVAVRRGRDRDKDQSYQLFAVREDDLARARLPLGELRKSEVRALAREAGLRTAHKQDSQEICFVPSNDYRELLRQRGVELHPGELVDDAGQVLGRHAGTEMFTIGQRRGHGVASSEPLYVNEIDPGTGRVVVGTRDRCRASRLELDELNLIGFDPPSSGEFEADVQLRYRHEPVPARVCVDGTRAELVLRSPEFAVAPGQGAALYLGDRMIGGGWIRTRVRAPIDEGDAGAAHGAGSAARAP